MTFLHCPRCRLAIRSRADYLTVRNCPRCLVRAGIVSPLFASPLNGVQLYAERQASNGRDPPPPRRRRMADEDGTGE